MQDRYIYVTGGKRKGNCIRTCDRYDLERDRWEEVPPMNYTRVGHASCVVHRTVYVFCGIHSHDISTNTIEKLDPYYQEQQARW